MFFPLGDTPNPKNFKPWVTWAIILANVAVYLFITLPLSLKPASKEDVLYYFPILISEVIFLDMAHALTAYDVFVLKHGFTPDAPELSDLFTCMFLHAGFLHLAGNMLFLWIFGDNVEHRLGRARYFIAYIVTGILATLTFSFFATKPHIPLVGASGAISGVVGFYFALFPRNRVRTFVFLFPFLMDVVLIPARWVIGFYILVDNLLPFILGAETTVAYGAHLGGFLAGALGAWLGQRATAHLRWRPVEGSARKSALEELRFGLSNLDREAALRGLSELTREDLTQLSGEEVARLASWVAEAGFPKVALALLEQYIYANPHSTELAPVHLMLGYLRLHQGQQAAAYQHFVKVFDYDADISTLEAARNAIVSLDIDPRALKHLPFPPRKEPD